MTFQIMENTVAAVTQSFSYQESLRIADSII